MNMIPTDYPMGPVLRHVLGVDAASYTGDQVAKPSQARKEEFEKALRPILESKIPFSQDEFSELVNELTSMDMPALTLFLCDHHKEFDLSKDFRSLLNIGAAAMLEAEYTDAIDLMKAAHQIEPKELAPYVNLAKIFLHLQRDEEAEQWSQAGLALEPNHRDLWEVLAKVLFIKFGRESCHERLLLASRKLNSFAGLSLSAEVVDDSLLKAQYLEDHYNKGERNSSFLVEYTAALGEAGQFEKIPQVLWEAENLPHHEGKIPWQLYLHVTQAYLSMEKDESARDTINKLDYEQQGIPEATKKEIIMIKAALEKELSDSL